MYLSWAAFYEGVTDSAYFNVLLPRVIDNLLSAEGVRPYDVAVQPSTEFGVSDRDFQRVAAGICSRKDEFHLLFIHADAGGRALREGIANRCEALAQLAADICQFQIERAIYLKPMRELEAWALSDPAAILSAFGLSSFSARTLQILPANPRHLEQVQDPKETLSEIARQEGLRKYNHSSILVRIAQEQSIQSLRRIPSFQASEGLLRSALAHAGCLRRP